MLAIAHRMMLPSRQRKEIGTSERPVSQLNTQPMVSPVNASRLPSRAAAHHSGPKWLAKPCFVENFHLLSFASLSWRTPLSDHSGSAAWSVVGFKLTDLGISDPIDSFAAHA